MLDSSVKSNFISGDGALRDDVDILRQEHSIRHLRGRHFAGILLLLAPLLVSGGQRQRHVIVLDPGHSHAAAVFAQESPALSDDVHVYAPPGPDVQAFLLSLSAFNGRSAHPTHWQAKPYIGADFQSRMLLEPPGNIVVISGRNNEKMDDIRASLQGGQHVLADKPWIIGSEQFPALEAALKMAAQRNLIAFDCMTERFNIAYRIQREIMRDREVFGVPLTGSASDPAVVLENLHSVLKFNHGNVNLRPSWFFDINEQGQAVADVGTHLVDLQLWTLFPEQSLDYRRDAKVVSATRTPIYLTREQFRRVTGEAQWPQFLKGNVRDDRLEYDCNNTAVFTMRGIYTRITDSWEYESVGALSDSYLVLYKGTRATVRVRESRLEHYVPELDVVPNSEQDGEAVRDALAQRIKELSGMFPNLSLRSEGREIRVVIPAEERERGGSTFAQLVACFLGYVSHPETYPKWETPNMLTKYYLTTKAAEIAGHAKISKLSSAVLK